MQLVSWEQYEGVNRIHPRIDSYSSTRLARTRAQTFPKPIGPA